MRLVPLKLKDIAIRAMVAPIIIKASRFAAEGSIIEGLIIPASGNTAKMLKIFEPTILPSAKSSSFFNTPAIQAASSGRLVPIAIMVNPITKSLRPKYLAISLLSQLKNVS